MTKPRMTVTRHYFDTNTHPAGRRGGEVFKSRRNKDLTMRISNAFPSKYLRASDIPDGREAHVKIDRVQLESMETTGDEKPVLYFIDRKKGLVLNRTNADQIASAYGDDTESWHGQPIILFITSTSFNGRTVPCLRVRIPRRGTAVAQETPIADSSVGDDDIPF